MTKRFMKGKRILALALALVMCLTLAACASNPPKETTPGSSTDPTGETGEPVTNTPESLTYAVQQSSLLVSPYAPNSSTRFYLREALNGYLALPAKAGLTVEEFDMDIAKSLKVVDDLTIEFELYDYVKDNKGNEIKASDVAFSFKACAESGNYPNVVSSVDSVDVTGDYTGTIHFKNGQIGRKEYAISNCAIVSEAWYSQASDEEISTAPASLGTYYVSDYVTGASVTCDKVTDYWQTDASLIPTTKRPGVNQIVFVVNAEPSQRVIALENGEVDATLINGADIHRFINDDLSAVDGYTVYRAPAIGGWFLFLNMDENGPSALAKNPKLREAICYGVDRESVMRAAGISSVSGLLLSSFGAPALAGYWDDPDYYTYDVDRAKQAMAESGLSDVELTAVYVADAGRAAALAVVQENLRELGINLNLKSVDQALLSTVKDDSSEWDILFDYKAASNGYVSYMFTAAFDSSNHKNGAVNFSHDKHLEELALAAATDFTEDNCIAFNKYLRDQYELIGLYSEYEFYVAQDGITQIGYDAAYYPVFQASTFAPDYKSVAR